MQRHIFAKAKKIDSNLSSISLRQNSWITTHCFSKLKNVYSFMIQFLQASNYLTHFFQSFELVNHRLNFRRANGFKYFMNSFVVLSLAHYSSPFCWEVISITVRLCSSRHTLISRWGSRPPPTIARYASRGWEYERNYCFPFPNT